MHVIHRISMAVLLACAGAAAYAQDAWDHKNGPRFVVLAPFASLAVLDQETGLVWERSPSPGAFTFPGAQQRCNNLILAGRMGWRVPTLQELTSILSIPNPPLNLEPGHPFGLVTGWQGQASCNSTGYAAAPAHARTADLA